MGAAAAVPIVPTAGPLNGSGPAPARDTGEQRFVFRRVNWAFYEGLLALIGERRYRVTYDRGSLELMAPAWNHEWWSRRLDRVLMGVGEAVGVDFMSGGSTTFRRRDLNRGLEPDQCYYTVNAHRMLGLRELDLSVDPPPDLALEVDFTHSSLDRLGIYAALGVAEVWRWDADGIHIYHLQRRVDEMTYIAADRSLSFPTLPVAQLVDFVMANQDLTDLRLVAAARTWAASGFPPTPPAAAAGDPPPPAL
jgi:Uma2 family endonuclease